MNTYRSPKTEIKQSLIHGNGIFAKELIKNGEIVAIKGGRIIDVPLFDTLDHQAQEFCLQIEDNFFIGPLTIDDVEENAIFINHSCAPNAGFKGQVTYVALRDILPGEEITQDYAMSFTYITAYKDVTCHCGAQECRGRIDGDDWQRADLQAKYGDNFSKYILDKILLHKGSK